MHGLDGGTEVDPGAVVRVRPGQDYHLGVRVLGVLHKPGQDGVKLIKAWFEALLTTWRSEETLVPPVSEGEHHGPGPAIQLLGVVHGEGGHVVLGAAQH